MLTKINLLNELKTSELIFDDEAVELHNQLDKALLERNAVLISFEGIELCSSLFMNALIGPLYGKYGTDADNYLDYIDISDENISNVIEKVKAKALKASIYSPLFEEAYSK